MTNEREAIEALEFFTDWYNKGYDAGFTYKVEDGKVTISILDNECPKTIPLEEDAIRAFFNGWFSGWFFMYSKKCDEWLES